MSLLTRFSTIIVEEFNLYVYKICSLFYFVLGKHLVYLEEKPNQVTGNQKWGLQNSKVNIKTMKIPDIKAIKEVYKPLKDSLYFELSITFTYVSAIRCILHVRFGYPRIRQHALSQFHRERFTRPGDHFLGHGSREM